MSDYFVVGGIYTNFEGEEWFDLVCPGPGETPYILADSVSNYFSLLWQNAHLYKVEEDYSLSLVAVSTEAQQWGVEAPVKVWPDDALVEKLRAIIRLS